MNEPPHSAVGSWPFLIDGGMGSSLEQVGSAAFGDAPGCNEILNRTRPEAIADVHQRYFAAGCHAVETNTFGGTPQKLASWGLGRDCLELNRLGAHIAKAVASSCRAAAAGNLGLVIGSLGPSGELPTSPDYQGPDCAEITAGFALQAAGLIKGGADILLVETAQDLLEFRCALLGCRRAMDEAHQNLPLWGSVCLHLNGRMLMGTGIDAALAVAAALGLDAFGLNCATGPQEMTDAVRYLTARSPMPILVYPNAGVPENRGGRPVFPMGPESFAQAMIPFLKMGVEIVGGCCGTTPDHLKALQGVLTAYRLRKLPGRIFSLASPVSAQEIQPEGSPLVVGERLNSQGSRKFRKLLLSRDWQRIADVAREQEERGAQVLDLALALSERDSEVDDMLQAVRTLTTTVARPLMIDTVSAEVAEMALALYPGVAILNSVNLERPERCEKLLEIAARYGAAVVAMTIDAIGMARTCDHKVDVAARLHALAVDQFGIPPRALLFDPLTFTLATGEEELRKSAVATLDAIKRLRENFPECGVILGVSNVSFGLPPAARKIVNAVFLLHARQAGLTAAIVNPSDILGFHEIPKQHRELAEDLIFDRQEDALERILETLGKKSVAKEVVVAPARSPVEMLKGAVLDRRLVGLEEVIAKCLATHTAEELVNTILMPTMKEVGDRMACNETILPHVLRSAEVMGRALEILAPHLSAGQAVSAGKVVLATVFGDVHDIGKNLVKAILANNGFEVLDLGKQVPAREIVETVDREKPLAVGLSALLVSTSQEMAACVKSLHERGLAVPVIVGGAAVSPAHADRIAQVQGETYQGGVHYGVDAFAGLDICRRLAAGEDLPPRKIARKREKKKQSKKKSAPSSAKAPKAIPVPLAPFLGTRQIDFCLQEVLARVPVTGGKNLYRPPAEIVASVAEALKREDLARPAAIYGYFSCRKSDETLAVEHGGLTYRFHYAPSKRKPSLSIWFQEKDLFIPYVVTLGKEAVDAYALLEQSKLLALSQEWAALCALMTEEAAMLQRESIARELGIPEDRAVLGVSPGYPLWRNIADQAPLLELLAANRLGISLTEKFQLVPEFSTTGIVVTHPEAAY